MPAFQAIETRYTLDGVPVKNILLDSIKIEHNLATRDLFEKQMNKGVQGLVKKLSFKMLVEDDVVEPQPHQRIELKHGSYVLFVGNIKTISTYIDDGLWVFEITALKDLYKTPY